MIQINPQTIFRNALKLLEEELIAILALAIIIGSLVGYSLAATTHTFGRTGTYSAMRSVLPADDSD